MVSWKGLAFIAALVAQVAAYQGNPIYARDYDSIYARDAEAEAYDDDSWGVYAREAEADYDDDLDLSHLGRRDPPGQIPYPNPPRPAVRPRPVNNGLRFAAD